MRYRRLSLAVAAAAMLGLAVPPAMVPAQASTIAMPLCGGGIMYLVVGGKHSPDRPGACHANCANRRDDDEGNPP